MENPLKFVINNNNLCDTLAFIEKWLQENKETRSIVDGYESKTPEELETLCATKISINEWKTHLAETVDVSKDLAIDQLLCGYVYTDKKLSANEFGSIKNLFNGTALF